MKKLITLLFLLSFFSLTQAQGIRFFQGIWKELLAASKASGKPIFVDVYTDWCIPCKKMEKEVFVNAEVGKFYNAHFIAYQLNADKPKDPPKPPTPPPLREIKEDKRPTPPPPPKPSPK